MESLPRFGPTERSSITVSGAGRAPSQKRRKNRCRFSREVAADLAAATDDRLVDDGSCQHLAVEHDGEGPADIVAGDFSKLACAERIEGKVDNRLVRPLIEANLGVRKSLAGKRDTALHRISVVVVGARQDINAARRGLGQVRGLIDHVEAHLGGRAKELAQACRVLETRELDKNAVCADALDQRFGDTDGINAPADDLEALLDRLGHAVGNARLGQRDRNDIAIRRDLDLGSGTAEADRADRRCQFLQFRLDLFPISRIGKRHGDRIAADARRRGRYALGAKNPTDVVQERVQPGLTQPVAIDLKDEMGTAAQVETEGDGLDRQPGA